MNEDVAKVHGDGTLVDGSVRVVDYDETDNNLLVRGSSAFGATNFTMERFLKDIKNDHNFPSGKITLSDNPQIVDFCLIGFGIGSKDEKIVHAEISWFTSDKTSINGNSGPYPTYISATNSGIASGTTMVYWPIQSLDTKLLTAVCDTWSSSPANSIGQGSNNDGFDYTGLISAIWNALQNQVANLPNAPAGLASIKDAIIYIHCDSGVNRTGAAVAGYLMTYGTNVSGMKLPSTNGVPYTLTQAQTAANSAPPSNDSPPGGVDIPVAQAYCNFIYTKNIDGSLIEACLPLADKSRTDPD
ncbi:MAG: hypothetical protein WGN25_12765 [Candidatus Electrothrix sp. GW3-4]|uniref:hypothetical protein n=1 Tax=Candidatus Electrothrix sp. GW3-4 TaxID=3126740 RepID=UPI0030D4C3F4